MNPSSLFSRMLAVCMFGQALMMKAQVEGFRANNIWGLLLWQYNEVRLAIEFKKKL